MMKSVWVSDNVETVSGRTMEEYKKITGNDLVHPDDLATATLPDPCDSTVRSANMRIRHADGHYYWSCVVSIQVDVATRLVWSRSIGPATPSLHPESLGLVLSTMESVMKSLACDSLAA